MKLADYLVLIYLELDLCRTHLRISIARITYYRLLRFFVEKCLPGNALGIVALEAIDILLVFGETL